MLKVKTMDDEYSDGSDHRVCMECGHCIDCGDCLFFGCTNEITEVIEEVETTEETKGENNNDLLR